MSLQAPERMVPTRGRLTELIPPAADATSAIRNRRASTRHRPHRSPCQLAPGGTGGLGSGCKVLEAEIPPNLCAAWHLCGHRNEIAFKCDPPFSPTLPRLPRGCMQPLHGILRSLTPSTPDPRRKPVICYRCHARSVRFGPAVSEKLRPAQRPTAGRQRFGATQAPCLDWARSRRPEPSARCLPVVPRSPRGNRGRPDNARLGRRGAACVGAVISREAAHTPGRRFPPGRRRSRCVVPRRLSLRSWG